MIADRRVVRGLTDWNHHLRITSHERLHASTEEAIAGRVAVDVLSELVSRRWSYSRSGKTHSVARSTSVVGGEIDGSRAGRVVGNQDVVYDKVLVDLFAAHGFGVV